MSKLVYIGELSKQAVERADPELNPHKEYKISYETHSPNPEKRAVKGWTIVEGRNLLERLKNFEKGTRGEIRENPLPLP